MRHLKASQPFTSEIIYFFDKVKQSDIIFSGRPRGDPGYPVTGIFAQRKKDRPNTLGLARLNYWSIKGEH